MKQDLIKQLLLGLLLIVLFVLSIMLVSALTTTREPDYTQSWLNIFGAVFIVLFVTIPTALFFIFFFIAAKET